MYTAHIYVNSCIMQVMQSVLTHQSRTAFAGHVICPFFMSRVCGRGDTTFFLARLVFEPGR